LFLSPQNYDPFRLSRQLFWIIPQKLFLYQKNPAISLFYGVNENQACPLFAPVWVIRTQRLSDILTIKRGRVEVNVGLQPGNNLRFEDLLYALLLPLSGPAFTYMQPLAMEVRRCDGVCSKNE